jgi:hypothetical protein
MMNSAKRAACWLPGLAVLYFGGHAVLAAVLR